MTYKEIHITMRQIRRLKGMLNMAARFAPELVEEATVKVVWDDDVPDGLHDKGVRAVFYVDEPTYEKAREHGAPQAAATVDEIPGIAEDYF